MSEEKHIITSLVGAANPADETLTIDKLLKTFEESQRHMDEMDDKLVESLMVAGFKVMINDAVPNGMMVAVLPRQFKGSLERIKDRHAAAGELAKDSIYVRNFLS